MHQPRQRRLERVKPVAQHRVKLRPRVAQRHFTHLAIKQNKPGLRLQRTDLVADGGRRHRQLVGGGLETAQARGGLKCPERRERKKSSLHGGGTCL
ncbi:hypothetical protein D3C87_1732790 [compost metagenome]